MEENAIGRRIKTERESKGLSLEKISDELRIPVKFLTGMERDDYSGFPGPTYEKAFLITYVKYLGLKSEEFLPLYKELRGEKMQVSENKTEKNQASEPAKFPFRKKQPLRIPEEAKYGTLAVLAIIFIILAVAGIRQCSASPSPAGPQDSSTQTQPRMVLTADVTDECWFEIVTDNEPSNKIMLKAGDKKKWEANNEFVLVNIGNKDALKLELDGKPVDLGSHKGKVVKDLTLRREGAKDVK